MYKLKWYKDKNDDQAAKTFYDSHYWITEDIGEKSEVFFYYLNLIDYNCDILEDLGVFNSEGSAKNFANEHLNKQINEINILFNKD